MNTIWLPKIRMKLKPSSFSVDYKFSLHTKLSQILITYKA